jgi:hypothetical protein
MEDGKYVYFSLECTFGLLLLVTKNLERYLSISESSP